MDQIFSSGTQMCLELWDYGGTPNVNAFTVVPTDQETATNSFSLLGGATTADDLFSIPATLANPNDQVLITANPFPADHTCPPPPSDTAASDAPSDMAASDAPTFLAPAQKSSALTSAATPILAAGLALLSLSVTAC